LFTLPNQRCCAPNNASAHHGRFGGSGAPDSDRAGLPIRLKAGRRGLAGGATIAAESSVAAAAAAVMPPP